jgi:hypothetical protein
MAKAAFNTKKKLFSSKLGLNLRRKLVKCYIWSVALYGAETWTLRAVDQKHLESVAWFSVGIKKTTDIGGRGATREYYDSPSYVAVYIPRTLCLSTRCLLFFSQQAAINALNSTCLWSLTAKLTFTSIRQVTPAAVRWCGRNTTLHISKLLPLLNAKMMGFLFFAVNCSYLHLLVS